MTRITPWLVSIVCLLGLTACAHKAPPQRTVISSQSTQTRTLPAFNHVGVDGNVNLSLHTGYRRSSVVLRGDPRDLANLVVSVSQGRLTIKTRGKGDPRYGPISLDVRTRTLNSITYKGEGIITGTKLSSRMLDLNIDNKGKTTLGGQISLRQVAIKGAGYIEVTGVRSQFLQLQLAGDIQVKLIGAANLSSLDVKDKAKVSLYWVKSNKLVIHEADDAYVQLAGRVDLLEVKLCDRSRFNGRYLRAIRAYVKTYGTSVAEIASVDHQHTLASDASNIYFYNLPKTRTDFMAFDGSVLDMRDWNMPFIQEYTRYTK